MKGWLARALVPIGTLLTLTLLVPDVDARGRGGGRGGGFSRGGGARHGSFSHRSTPRGSPGRSASPRQGASHRASSVSRSGPASSGSLGGRVGTQERGGGVSTRESRPQRGEEARTRPSERPEERPGERLEEGREDRQEHRDEAREDRQAKYDEVRNERQAWAGAIHEEREEFFEHYSSPYYRYPYPYYGGGTRIYISITQYNSYPCQKETVVVNGKTYYRCDSGWYDRVSKDGDVQYVAVPPPSGAEVTTLQNPTEIRVGGETFYMTFRYLVRKMNHIKIIPFIVWSFTRIMNVRSLVRIRNPILSRAS